MTILEKQSQRKKKAIYYMVKIGEMSIANALHETEELHDAGKLLDVDYEELAEYLESLLEPVEEVSEEISAETAENTEDTAEITNEEAE